MVPSSQRWPTGKYLLSTQLGHAFKLKNVQPHKDWFSIAQYRGYYDYQHPARHFKECTGFTPPVFTSRKPVHQIAILARTISNTSLLPKAG